MNLQITYQQLNSEEILDVSVRERTEEIGSISIDSRTQALSKRQLFIAIEGEQFNGNDFVDNALVSGYQRFVVSKKDLFVDLKQKGIDVILVRNGLRFLQDLAKLHRLEFDIPLIAITGSNGKTICKEWIYQLLNDEFHIHRSPKSYNSQVGVALSLLELNSTHELAIIEAGVSKQGEMIRLEEMIQPTFGLMTNNLDAHLSGFDSLIEKNAEKHILFNNSIPLVENESTAVEPHNLTWTWNDVEVDTFEDSTRITMRGDEFVIPFTSKIYIENAIQSYFVATYFTKDKNALQKKMSQLQSVMMRWEEEEGKDNILLINDSYSLDLGSLRISLEQLAQMKDSRKRVLVLGIKGAEEKVIESYVELIQHSEIDQVIIIAPSNNRIVDLFKYQLGQRKQTYCKEFEEFKEVSKELSDAVILFKSSRSASLSKELSLFKKKNHRTKLTIDLGAMRSNLLYYSSLLENKTKTLVMVKAASYGAGLKEITTFISQNKVDYLGVAFTDEGVALRAAGIELPIIVMNPDEEYFELAIINDLEPAVYSLQHLDNIIRVLIANKIKNYPIHLKFDTGMHRLGFEEDQLIRLIDTLKSQPEVKVRSMFSHFSMADEPLYDDFTKKQFDLFQAISIKMSRVLGYHIDQHICNSNATIRFKDYHLDMVRIGIGLHGIEVKDPNLVPTLKLSSYVSQIRTVDLGETIGYGSSFVANQIMKIAIVPIGYADGITRSFGNNGGFVCIQEQQCRVIGNLCMDMMMVDITNLVQIKEGELVEIFGEFIPVEVHAKYQNTISYEVISKISERVTRVYVKE